MSFTSNKQNSRYMAGIDSLRGIAILAVIVYHLNFNWLPGGFLGVTVFFVLSGYLITDILIAEWEQHKRINLKAFLLRRARRLLPAMLVMLVTLLAWLTLFNEPLLWKIREDVLAAVLYCSNWWFIYHKVSYFDRVSQPSLLNHFWSLAVEEQFYLIWPLVLISGLRFINKKSHIVIIILLGAIISAVAMAIIYHPDSDPSRVYYGTDTRIFSLLIGAALALLWPSSQLTTTIVAPARWALDVVGGISLILIVIMFWETNQYESFVYYGGMLLVSVLTAIVVAVLAHPAAQMSKLLKFKPLNWIGVRSYGLYLWHYPIFVLTSQIGESDQVIIVRVIFQLLLTFIVAQLSWEFIEYPIRQGALYTIWRNIRSENWGIINFSLGSKIMLIGISLASIVAIWGVSTATYAKSDFRTHMEAKAKESSKEVVPSDSEKLDKSISKPRKPEAEVAQKQESNTQKQEIIPKQSKENLKVTAIGDSIMLDVKPYLEKAIPNIIVDAKIGRQMSSAITTVQQLSDKGSLGDYVIIALGTNGPFSSETLKNLLNLIGSNHKIIVVNNRVPEAWESVGNKRLKEVSSQFSNVKLIDWYLASAGHETYFEPDHTHLKPTGAQAYAKLITSQIQ